LNAYSTAFRPIWQRYHYTDLSFFPGDYLINWPFVFLFKGNKWGVSIPHILVTLLGFYFLYLICKRYFHSLFAWLATFALVAIHRELIYYSFEFRPYAVLPTLALAVFYFTEEIVSHKFRLSLMQKISIGIFYVFTIIYHCYGAVLLFFTFSYFLLRESGERSIEEIFKHTRRFIGTMLLIGVPLYLWYTVYNDFVISGFGSYTFDYIPNPITNPLSFVKVILCCLAGNKILYFLAGALILPFILPYRERLQQIGFMLVLIILPILVVMYFDLLSVYHFLQRQFTWAMALFAFLVGWCIDSGITFIKQKRKMYA
jgi:hypothetical protein